MPVPFTHYPEIHPFWKTSSQLEIGMLASGQKTARKALSSGQNTARLSSPMAVGHRQNVHCFIWVEPTEAWKRGIYCSSKASRSWPLRFFLRLLSASLSAKSLGKRKMFSFSLIACSMINCRTEIWAKEKCQSGEKVVQTHFQLFSRSILFLCLMHTMGQKEEKCFPFNQLISFFSFLFLVVGFWSFHEVCEAPRVGKNDSMW